MPSAYRDVFMPAIDGGRLTPMTRSGTVGNAAFSYGGKIKIYLTQDDENYYEIINTDGYGGGGTGRPL